MQRLQVQMDVEQKKESNNFLVIIERVLESMVYLPGPSTDVSLIAGSEYRTACWAFKEYFPIQVSKRIFHPPAI